jgi:hypothetical protein
MKKTIAIIVAAIFLFSMATISLGAEEKAQAAKPTEKTPAEVQKSTSQEMKEPVWTEELKKEEKQDVFKELTPEEKEKQLKEFEEQEKKLYKNVTPEDMNWGEPEKPAGGKPEWPAE